MLAHARIDTGPGPEKYRVTGLRTPYNQVEGELDVDIIPIDLHTYVILTDRDNPGTSVSNGIEYYALQICEQLQLDWYRCVFIETYEKSTRANDIDQRFDQICFEGVVHEEFSPLHQQSLKYAPLRNMGWQALPVELAMGLVKAGAQLTQLLGKKALFKDSYSAKEFSETITAYDGNRYYKNEPPEVIQGEIVRAL